MIRRELRCWLLLLGFFPLLGLAQPVGGYSVELSGAGALTTLLQNNLEITRHSKDAGLNTEELQRLVAITPQQISALLATEGYFSSQVSGSLEQSGGRPVARFAIEPGTPVLVDTVDLRFSGHIASNPEAANRIDRLRRQWGLRTGQRFRQADWDEAKGTLLKGLLNRDYPAARIADSEARIDPPKGNAQLRVEVDSGPAFTFGELQVQGLSRYSRSMIDTLNPIVPGERFSQEKLNELQSRLQDSGYFRSAFATIEVDPLNPRQVPVRVDLNENERKRLGLGIGFSTDSGARAQVKWLDRNFLGRNWRLESNLTIDRPTRIIGADVFLPPLKNGWRPAFGGNFERSDIANVINDKVRSRARLSSPDKDNELTWGVAYLADRQRVADIAPNNRQALVASVGIVRRRLDNPLTPRQGTVVSAELSAGPGGLLNERHLARVTAQATWLHPFDRKWNTVLRAQFGQVFGAGRESVPEDLLFRTGGDQTVRGYSYNSLGVAQNGAVVGGTVLAVLSAELVYQLTREYGIAVFTDAGNAADSWGDLSLRHGSGIGARWRSPIGPINIDLAYGHQTRQPRLHFSVGYGF